MENAGKETMGNLEMKLFGLIHTGKCICRFAGILRILPVLHLPEVVDIGVSTI